ncbi:hypothetical protein QTI24_20930 [Variovorax sp. J22P240]|uniref:hypothetical protein n=1 Tax=Variovorax sp. J22P240 TaxID=3053514 RepID=UPI002576DAB3|nr:hypothetical protein [Variovorax sp. J22P240]MDM0001085.1 hypothetical protein [Variovorax sp. J22P240]
MTTQTETAVLGGRRLSDRGKRLQSRADLLSNAYVGGNAPKVLDLSAVSPSQPSKGPHWLPYFAPLAIIAISALCAAVTVSVDAPRQALAAENVANVGQLVAAVRGIRSEPAGLDS